MIMSVGELKQLITTDKPDQVLELMLQALEKAVIGYTNNNFVDRESGEVVYPPDVKLGVVNMAKWELENRDKVGVQSETISRHSVTYFDMSSANTVMGYPVSLLGFLKPYRKARF